MPDETPPFRLPIPLQPVSHHALGLHNSPLFQYDLMEFLGEGGAPLVVIEPRRADGRAQAPLKWFASRVLEGVGEAYGGHATILFHDVVEGDEVWLVSRDLEIPVFDDKNPAVVAELDKIKTDAAAAGVPMEVALQAALAAGLITPSETRTRTVLAQIRPERADAALAEIFSHHVAPNEISVSRQQVGFPGAAAAREAIVRGAEKPPTPRRRRSPGLPSNTGRQSRGRGTGAADTGLAA